ncbi:RNA polymerase subunit sigma [Streptomyces sp. NPDC047706]|uniref:RNA polymerase subunit sigma n=1 Tax=Streptomyces sp. NPDC047706 TaxID=3365486 RepID=UPI003712CA1C
MNHPDDAVPIVELLDERRHLLDMAHRMLGDSSEAESVIDETYRRWYGLSGPARAAIAEPGAWLAAVAGGICISRLARPIWGTGMAVGPPAHGARADPHEELGREVGSVLRGALHSLSRAERTAFMLNEVIERTARAVDDIMGQPERPEQAHPAAGGPPVRRAQSSAAREEDAMAHAFRRAWATEDEALLAYLLTADATASFDGGGKVRALVTPVHGARQIARSLMMLLPPDPRTSLQTRKVNGRTGLVVYFGRKVAAVISLDIAGRRVRRIWVVLNPDKLRSWNDHV